MLVELAPLVVINDRASSTVFKLQCIEHGSLSFCLQLYCTRNRQNQCSKQNMAVLAWIYQSSCPKVYCANSPSFSLLTELLQPHKGTKCILNVAMLLSRTLCKGCTLVNFSILPSTDTKCKHTALCNNSACTAYTATTPNVNCCFPGTLSPNTCAGYFAFSFCCF